MRSSLSNRRWPFAAIVASLLANASVANAIQARAQPPASIPTEAPSPAQIAHAAATTAFEAPLHQQLVKRAEVKAVDGYTHLGCWQDGSNHILSVTANFDNGMTPELCRNVCSIASCNMFGVENGYHCYCGNSIEAFAVSATDDSCTATCWGAKDVICGAGQRMNVYSATADFPAGKQYGVDGSGTQGSKPGATTTRRGSGSNPTSEADPGSGSDDSDSNPDSSAESGSNSGSQGSTGKNGLSTGAIVGIVVAVAAIVCAVTAAAVFTCMRKRRRQEYSRPPPSPPQPQLTFNPSSAARPAHYAGPEQAQVSSVSDQAKFVETRHQLDAPAYSTPSPAPVYSTPPPALTHEAHSSMRNRVYEIGNSGH